MARQGTVIPPRLVEGGSALGGKKKITATVEHLFWVPKKNAWINAADLKPGTTLSTPDGTTARIVRNDAYTDHVRTYNFTVANFHTYYVLAGTTPVLVHNTCGPETLHHYTTEEKMKKIMDSGELWASTKAAKPQDAKLGDGKYLSDIAPGTKRPGQLARAFYGTPWGGRNFSHYISIDVRGLPLVTAPDRPGVFLIPNEGPLDIAQRIQGFGAN